MNLARGESVPVDVFTSEFKNVAEGSQLVYIVRGTLSFSYSAEIGYHEKETYIEEEYCSENSSGAYYVGNGKYIRKREKTRDKTRWTSYYNDYHTSYETGVWNAKGIDLDFSSTLVSLIKSIDPREDGVKRYFNFDSTEIDSGDINEIGKALLPYYSDKVKRKLPGDEYRKFKVNNANNNANTYEIYLLPIKEYSFNYKGHEQRMLGFTCGMGYYISDFKLNNQYVQEIKTAQGEGDFKLKIVKFMCYVFNPILGLLVVVSLQTFNLWAIATFTFAWIDTILGIKLCKLIIKNNDNNIMATYLAKKELERKNGLIQYLKVHSLPPLTQSEEKELNKASKHDILSKYTECKNFAEKDQFYNSLNKEEKEKLLEEHKIEKVIHKKKIVVIVILILSCFCFFATRLSNIKVPSNNRTSTNSSYNFSYSSQVGGNSSNYSNSGSNNSSVSQNEPVYNSDGNFSEYANEYLENIYHEWWPRVAYNIEYATIDGEYIDFGEDSLDKYYITFNRTNNADEVQINGLPLWGIDGIGGDCGDCTAEEWKQFNFNMTNPYEPSYSMTLGEIYINGEVAQDNDDKVMNVSIAEEFDTTFYKAGNDYLTKSEIKKLFETWNSPVYDQLWKVLNELSKMTKSKVFYDKSNNTQVVYFYNDNGENIALRSSNRTDNNVYVQIGNSAIKIRSTPEIRDDNILVDPYTGKNRVVKPGEIYDFDIKHYDYVFKDNYVWICIYNIGDYSPLGWIATEPGWVSFVHR